MNSINSNPITPISSVKVNSQTDKTNTANNIKHFSDRFISFQAAEKPDRARPISELKGNFNNEIKIILSDIDGTINYKYQVPESAKSAINELNEKKIPVILPTGKTFQEAKRIAAGLNIHSDFFITQHGAEIIRADGKILFHDTIAPEEVKKIIEHYNYAKQNFAPKSQLVLIVDGERCTLENYPPPFDWGKQGMKVVDSFDDILKSGRMPTVIVIYDPDKQTPSITEYFKEKLPSHLSVVNPISQTCEIHNDTVSKGKAIKQAAEIFNIDLKNAAALGDADNDLPMMNTIREEGGLTVAMGNSSENVIQAAEFITADVDKDGFKTAIDTIFENNRHIKECSYTSEKSFVAWVKGLIFRS